MALEYLEYIDICDGIDWFKWLLWEVYRMNQSVCLSVLLVSETNIDETWYSRHVVVYGLRMCMKEDNPGLKNIKGDNYLYGIWVILCDLTHSSS